MSMTKIRGKSQIIEKSIEREQLSDTLNLRLSQIEAGAELLKRDGSVKMTGNLDVNSKKVLNVANGTEAGDAVNVAQLTAAIAALPNPMEYKGTFDPTVDLLPSSIDIGDVYVITAAGTFNGEDVQAGAEIIAKLTKASGTTAADFDVVNRQDQVQTVAGRKGAVVLKLEDITDVTVAADEVNTLEGVIGNIQVQLDGKLDDGQLVTDDTLVSADDATVATSRAVKVYVDRADQALDSKITANKTAVEGVLAQEVADRKAADTVLGDRITDLEEQVGTDLQAKIDAEKTDRQAADNALDGRVAATEADIIKLKGDATIEGSVAKAVKDAVEVEKAAREAAMAEEVLNRVADIDAEEARALAAESALDSKVDSTKAELQSQITAAVTTIPVPVDEEVPAGLVDGINADFKLAFVPVAGSVKAFLNGMRQRAGADNDFTVVIDSETGLANIIRFNEAPEIGDTIVVDYRK